MKGEKLFFDGREGKVGGPAVINKKKRTEGNSGATAPPCGLTMNCYFRGDLTTRGRQTAKTHLVKT